MSLDELREALKENLRRLVEEEVDRLFKAYMRDVERLEPPHPLPADDPAVRWLVRLLRSVDGYVRPVIEEGRLVAVEYSRSIEDVERRIIRPARWAFEKAGGRSA